MHAVLFIQQYDNLRMTAPDLLTSYPGMSFGLLFLYYCCRFRSLCTWILSFFSAGVVFFFFFSALREATINNRRVYDRCVLHVLCFLCVLSFLYVLYYVHINFEMNTPKLTSRWKYHTDFQIKTKKIGIWTSQIRTQNRNPLKKIWANSRSHTNFMIRKKNVRKKSKNGCSKLDSKSNSRETWAREPADPRLILG